MPRIRFETGPRLMDGADINNNFDYMFNMPAVGKQGTPTALTTSATMTAAQMLTGIITSNEGAGGAPAYQLPTAAALDLALPWWFTIGDQFEFALINVSTVAAEDASITTNTGWTLVGSMAVQSNDAITSKSSGRFRVRQTAANAFTIYRVA